MLPARHRISRPHFDALVAGHGDESALRALLRVERTWRLGLLRLVLDALRAEPALCGPLTPAEQVWDLLVAAERRDASAVAEVLRYPPVGTWAAHVLRRLRESEPASTETPLWSDIGYLHMLAASTAIRAQLDFAVTVPAADGYVVLPTLGCARLPQPAVSGAVTVQVSGEVVTISSETTSIRIPQRAGAEDGWLALPQASAQVGEHTIAVQLDSFDPYRAFRGPQPPQLLRTEHIRRWRDHLAQAWQLLGRACPQLLPPVGMSVSMIVPLLPNQRFRVTSASAGDAFGAMTVSQPRDGVELAATLVHEFQHMKLGALLHLVSMHDREPPQRLYAPWRDDPRPLAGLLQGAYAFTGVAEFWQSARNHLAAGAKRHAEFEFARWRQHVLTVLRQLRDLPELTDFGRQLVSGLSRVAISWPADAVPPDVGAAADAAATDHWLRWRLHHLRPDPTAVTALATAWLAGAAPPPGRPPAPTVEPDRSATALGALATQSLWRLVDPAGFAALRADPESAPTVLKGSTDIGLAVASGELGAAFHLCLTTIAKDPERIDAWAALGGTAAAQGHHSAAAMLCRRPELVRAVHRRVERLSGAPVSPLTIADWLSRALSPTTTAAPGRGRHSPAD